MKWTRFSIKTTTQAEDVLISALSDIGVEGVEIVDNVPLTEEELSEMFVDIGPEKKPDDGSATLNFYVEEPTEDLLIKVQSVLEETRSFMDIGEGSISVSETEDKDWINNWKQYFHQFSVGDIHIVPSWESLEGDEADYSMVLHIDPGTAFGTGMHETTQLVIGQLQKLVRPGMKVLDVGTGSGILGIVALKLGASSVMATDLDPCTVNAVSENLEANQVDPSLFTLHLGNLIDDRALKDTIGYDSYDLVCANILAGVLVPLTGSVVQHMKKGAYYVTSGIIEGKQQQVKDAMEAAGLTVLIESSQGEWYQITGRKE